MNNSNNNFSDFSSFLSNLSPLEFTTLGCIIGLIITANLNSNEQNSIGNFFELVGQVILTAQAQGQFNTPQAVSLTEFNNFKKEIQQAINKIINKF